MADRWTARSAARKLFDQAIEWPSPTERDRLRRLLAPRSLDEVAGILHLMRGNAIELLKMTPAARRRQLATLPDHARLVSLYAMAAWSCRTLVLFEILERSPLEPRYPAKWAGDAALRLMQEFEGERVWLWPFDDASPWPDTEEDDEE